MFKKPNPTDHAAAVPGPGALLQKGSNAPASLRFRVVLAVTGVLLFFAATLLFPPSLAHFGSALLISLFIAIQFNLPLDLLGGEANLIHIVTLGCGLLYGPSWAGWAATGGVLLGYFGRKSWQGRWLQGKSEWNPAWLEALFSIGVQNIAIVLSLGLAGWTRGAASPGFEVQIWPAAAGPMFLFGLIHGLSHLVDYLVRKPQVPEKLRADLVWLTVIELLPLPFILIAVLSYQITGLAALVALGGVPVMLAALLFRVSSTTHKLGRRLEELATLNQISQALQGMLDLNGLLTFLHLQISRFLDVDNFYVALYNQEEGLIWYPMAVKGGVHVSWDPRPLTDRLTDKVILERRPIMLPHPFQDGYRGTGMPPGESAPSAWMGVPLVTTKLVNGCLGVFSYDPGKGFAREDLDWLVTISGQVSVAIENALLLEQAQRRAAQLETLNKITVAIGSSLEPEQVLEQVCRSVTQVVGGQHSAIFLLDLDADNVWLAYAYKFTEAFIQQNKSFSLAHDGRTRCLRTGHPSLIDDLRLAQLDPDFKASLQREGVRTFGDFPLVTSAGQIGYLSLYFDEIHTFNQEELDLLQTFAAQAALAVANARLYANTDSALSRRVRQLSALQAIGRELAAATHSDGLFELILDLAMESSQARWGNFRQHDREAGELVVKASRGYKQPPPSHSLEAGVDGSAARTGKVVTVSDIRTYPGYIDYTHGKARSLLSIPLTHQGQVLGVLTLESPQINAFSAEQIAFVNQLADQATIALANAELYSLARQGRDRLQAVLNSVSEGIIMVDPNGKIVLANNSVARLTGSAFDEAIGYRLDDLPAERLHTLGYSQKEASALQARFEQKDLSPQVETRLALPCAGQERSITRAVLPVWSENDTLRGWMIVLRDTTDELQVDQARELLTETLVHDLRSPLSAVVGALDVIREAMTTELPEKTGIITQAAQVARRATQRLLGLVESLLDIARLQSGEMEIVAMPVNLSVLVAAVMSDHLNQAEEYGLILRNEVNGTLPPANADPNMVQRVLTNLVDNALNFTPSGGQVIVSAGLLGDDQLALRVSDSGPGIPEEYRGRIFSRFTQIPGVRGRRRGSGLGLTFCRLAVEAHGGKIWVEPRSGGGSVFVFTLPVAPPSG